MSEQKRREVLQLLREYRAFWSPYGGAMPLDDTGVIDANYGAAGYIEAGQEYGRQKALLLESYAALENAITMLKAGGQDDFICWLMLLSPYLGEPGDPSIVDVWRRRGHYRRVEIHDRAVEKLSRYLRSTDLFVVWPKRMTSQEEKQIERRNDELYALYRRLREDGENKTQAVKDAAIMCGYSERRAWDIVGARTSVA